MGGDATQVLANLPNKSFRSCITSPPYWKQRNYGNHPDQIGQERDPDIYVHRLADLFMEVHRLLTKDGTLWVVIDDSYRHKQLVGVPWRLALELQRRGWLWRSEIVWAKASTPEPTKDRPTRAHEVVLMFAKAKRYYYDHEAMLEPHDNPWAIDCINKAQTSQIVKRQQNMFDKEARCANKQHGITRAQYGLLMNPNGKNRRDVWTLNADKWRGSHSATMPVALAELCVRASTAPGDVVLDPFCGTGTTGVAAVQSGWRFVGVELLPKYVAEAQERLQNTSGLAVKTSGSG